MDANAKAWLERLARHDGTVQRTVLMKLPGGGGWRVSVHRGASVGRRSRQGGVSEALGGTLGGARPGDPWSRTATHTRGWGKARPWVRRYGVTRYILEGLVQEAPAKARRGSQPARSRRPGVPPPPLKSCVSRSVQDRQADTRTRARAWRFPFGRATPRGRRDLSYPPTAARLSNRISLPGATITTRHRY